jgi:hypothetical protein
MVKPTRKHYGSVSWFLGVSTAESLISQSTAETPENKRKGKNSVTGFLKGGGVQSNTMLAEQHKK